MNILFISEPYIERSLFEYFYQNNSHKFILLKANHSQIQEFERNNILFLDLEEALQTCNGIYFLSTDNVPTSLLNKCQSYISESKSDIELYFQEINHENDVETYIEKQMLLTKYDLPNILILQVGENAQLERTEIELCAELKNSGIGYVLHSNSWIDCISNMARSLGLFDPSEKNEKTQIEIVSIKADISQLITNDVKNMYFEKFVRFLRPDYIIMCCENDYNHQQFMNNVISVKYSRAIDLFVKSEYVLLKFNDEEITLFVQDIKYEALLEDIKNKLTFPKGIQHIF